MVDPTAHAGVEFCEGDLLYLHLVHEWGWLDSGQYAHVSEMVAEIGRLLGGWLRQSRG